MGLTKTAMDRSWLCHGNSRSQIERRDPVRSVKTPDNFETRLAGDLHRHRPPSSMPCPSESALLALATGRASDPHRASLEQHIADCPLCRELVAAIVPSLGCSAGSTTSGTSGHDPIVGVPLPRGSEVGRFLVLGVLGSGAFATVYRAHDPQLDREVALKVMRLRDDQRDLLTAEAKAMARLTHPNVVTVYDVGQAGADVFIAMELVDGPTVRQWTRSARRSPREVLRVFVAAGRGLAAAHDAGLIHRDFKPDNVLIGSDGSVKVADFGLSQVPAPTATQESAAKYSSDTAEATDPARKRRVVGTPAYMAPEVIASGQTDARSDQYSFCAALFEALYGHRPFQGRTLLELQLAQSSGAPTRRPGRRVPRWLDRAITRGMSPRATQRWPSMAELVDALRHGRHRRRIRATAISFGALALAATATFASVEARHKAQCWDSAQRAGMVWNGSVHDEVSAQLTEAGPWGARTATAVAKQLDAYADAWTSSRYATCMDRGRDRTPDIEARLEACLEDRWVALDQTVALLRDADTDLAQRSVLLTERLPAVSACLDPLQLGPTYGGDNSEEAQEIRRQTAEAGVLYRAGEFSRGLETAAAARQRALAVGRGDLALAAGYTEGIVLVTIGEYERAEQALVDTHRAAVEHHDTRHEFDAALQLASLEGLRQNDAAARVWLTNADATYARIAAADDGELRAQWLRVAADNSQALGNLPQALEHAREALRLSQQAAAGTSTEAAAMHGLGTTLMALGQRREGVEYLQQALDLSRRILGEDHPYLEVRHFNAGTAYQQIGDYTTARMHLDRARTIAEQAKPAPKLALEIDGQLAQLDLLEGKLDDAYARASEAAARCDSSGGAPLTCAALSATTGLAAAKQGRPAAAEPYFAAGKEPGKVAQSDCHQACSIPSVLLEAKAGPAVLVEPFAVFGAKQREVLCVGRIVPNACAIHG